MKNYVCIQTKPIYFLGRNKIKNKFTSTHLNNFEDEPLPLPEKIPDFEEKSHKIHKPRVVHEYVSHNFLSQKGKFF